MSSTDELFALAERVGIQTGYWDTKGEFHTASVDAVIAVLGAMGFEISGPDDLTHLRDRVTRVSERLVSPVVVHVAGRPLPRDLGSGEGSGEPVRIEVVSESGEVSSGPDLGIELDVGYHRLVVETATRRDEALLLVTPGAVVTPPPDERIWGVFAPVYSLWSTTGQGPTVAGLERLADRMHELGARVVATLPMLASYLGEPFDPSPYTPVSRLFWNELFLDVDVEDHPGPFDYERRARAVDAAIAGAAGEYLGGESRADLDAFIARRPDVIDYARFRATAERFGAGWHSWPTRQRRGRLQPGDYDPQRVRHHLFAQWMMDRRMRDLGGRLESRGQHLYLDLPVGSHGDGYDTWRFGEDFVRGVSVGAPPDDFFSGGQNWGFPPVSPEATSRATFGFLRACLEHHMSVSGIVRLDHVMQLERLWWIPEGMAAPDGVYVRYPRAELFAVVAIESHRFDCVVVGENLGTVSDEVGEAMARHSMPGMYVAQFEMPDWAGAELAEPRSGSVASFDTHDTATFAGFVAGDHAQQVENMRGFLTARGFMESDGDDHALLLALLAFMGESDAWTVLVTLEDLWGETNPQNIPGTPFDRPNWVQRLALSLDSLETDPSIRADLATLEAARARARR